MNKKKEQAEIFKMPIICHCLDDEHKATNLAKVLGTFGRRVEDYKRWIVQGDKDDN